MPLAEELHKLQVLRDAGTLTEEEFAAAKQKLINEQSPPPRANSFLSGSTIEEQTRRWAILLHLSLLAGHIIPLAGFIAPILIWQTQRDQLPGLEEHGKNAANWIFTELILLGIGFILAPFFIGFLILIPLFIVAVIFPIFAALKASNGIPWKYPLSFSFLK